jgi:glycosyltransferase involved in cell wall biosynthesis
MIGEARVAVVVPCYAEERLLGRTLATMPAFVDHVVVVDDASPDATVLVARAPADPRVELVRHDVNRGVGAAIVTGYRAALVKEASVIAVMAGDAQMHPDDLASVVTPVVEGRADYVKGNRFAHPLRHQMPRARRLAGKLLSAMTRFFTGLEIDDSQCGYTALSAAAARKLPLSQLWPRFGYPNDLLGLLAADGFRVAEVPVQPVYGEAQSGVRPYHALIVGAVILRRYIKTRWRAPRAFPTSAARARDQNTRRALAR